MINSTSKKYIYWGLFFHFAAVIFSIGYYNHDEQRQVLQMVGYKLSMIDKSFLDFQYQSQIRSWLHPIMYVWIGKIYLLFAKPDPFHLAMVFRFFSSLLGISSIWVLFKSFKTKLSFEISSENYFLFSSLMWFIPFLHARTSNENLCTSFFIFGLYFFKKSGKFKDYFWCGFLWAFSFFLRFQMAFMIIPAMIWSLFGDNLKARLKNFIPFTLGFLLMSIINTLIDFYYYGNLTFTPFNYIEVNFFKHYLTQFGTSPWYEYVSEGFRYGPKPFSLLFILSFFLFWLKRPKDLITAMTLPFFIIHSFIGHKELRFIFPIIMFLPIIMTILLDELPYINQKKLKIFFLFFNIPLIIYNSFIPASSLTIFYRHLYYKSKLVDKIYVFAPYEDYVKFYRKTEIKYPIINESELHQIVQNSNYSYFIATSSEQREAFSRETKCHQDYTLAPNWIYEISFLKHSKKFKKWSFFECGS